MELFGLHVPGTRDASAEIAKLKEQLDDRNLTVTVMEQGRDRLIKENLDLSVKLSLQQQNYQEQDAIRQGQIRMQADRAERFKEENRELRQEAEAYRLAFNALAEGHELKADRMLELARRAAQIQHDSNRSCSLSYELYAVQVCNEADRILPSLDEKEAKFLQAALGGDYTPSHERGQDWQSEHEIRRGLYREMYGDPDAYDDFAEDQEEEQEQERGVDDREEEPEQERQQGRGLSIGL